jgi:translin
VDLSSISEGSQRRFEATTAARERALTAARRAIRSSANAIRAIHRGEFDRAHELMDEARQSLETGAEAVRADHPEIYFAGFLQDAQKEYAEARFTEVIVGGGSPPSPDDLGVGLAPYLNGMAEAIGEGRRAALDHLRHGEPERAQAILDDLEDVFGVLVSIDFPDAVTGNLRRSTDVARSLLERTRGDVTMALVQRRLQDALGRQAEAGDAG